MIKYRLCYSKYGDAKYISHLDLIRLFARSFKRADIPLTYSEGFNPHAKIAIGLPLSVGVTSECEYMDAETERPLSVEDITRLNKSLPIGIHINAAKERTPNMKKLADIHLATYTVTVTCQPPKEEEIKDFLSRQDVMIEKKTKRKEEETNILPDIFSLEMIDAGPDVAKFSMTLSAGPSANLKPDLVLAAMALYIPDFIPQAYDIHRTNIMADCGMPLM